jgi:ABC-type transport system involved in multi-copper enzyme maturation permease subunit
MEQPNNSYMPIAVRFSVIFGLITFLGGLVMGYMVMSMEPSPMVMIVPSVMGIGICLIAAIAGLLVVRNFIKTTGENVAVGRGAVIGLVTGVLIGVIGSVLSLIWELVDPNFAQNMMNAMVGAVDTMSQLDQAGRDQMIDQMMANDPTNLTTRLTNFGMNIIFMAIANVITGMIGAAIFSKKEDTL